MDKIKATIQPVNCDQRIRTEYKYTLPLNTQWSPGNDYIILPQEPLGHHEETGWFGNIVFQ